MLSISSRTDLPVLPDAATQTRYRTELYNAHRVATLDSDWHPDGRYKHSADGLMPLSYRGSLWPCLAYLEGDSAAVDCANHIIVTQRNLRPCHFSPGAATDLLLHCNDQLTDESQTILQELLELNLPYLTTEDLKIHGYNDNHPFKAMHALILGGAIIGDDALIRRGKMRLQDAVVALSRNGFPCEYNSPNYAPITLQPLAALADEAADPEIRQLAGQLEHFYWRDLALHFDAQGGLMTGPMSRAYPWDYEGMLSPSLRLLHYLFPQVFSHNLTELIFAPRLDSRFFGSLEPERVTFLRAHQVWYARSQYHITPEIIELLFAKPAGVRIRGLAETGTAVISWSDSESRPENAPARLVRGPRRPVLETYFGKDFTLGTASAPWLNNQQAHALYATLSRSSDCEAKIPAPEGAAVWFARQFTDENYPYGLKPYAERFFSDMGEPRALQHENTALLFYSPLPWQAQVKQIRTGLFRPLHFSRPRAVYAGETPLPTFNAMFSALAPIAVDEGLCYVGIIPLPLMQARVGQSCREIAMEFHTRAEHLSILFTSREYWSTVRLRYEDFFTTLAGFSFEIHPADTFANFAAFRQYLAEIRIDDAYYADMRTTTYSNKSLTLSAAYSPYSEGFRYTSVNGRSPEHPIYKLEGMDSSFYPLG